MERIRFIIKWLTLSLKYGPRLLSKLSKIYKKVEHDYNRWQEKQGKAKIQEMKRRSFLRRAHMLYNIMGNTYILEEDIEPILEDVWKLHNTKEPEILN